MPPTYLPAPFDDEGNVPKVGRPSKADRMRSKAELEVYRYTLGSLSRSAMDQTDSQALGDAAGYALDVEIDLYDYGLSRAGQSVAKLALVGRKVELVANANNRRLGRRFA